MGRPAAHLRVRPLQHPAARAARRAQGQGGTRLTAPLDFTSHPTFVDQPTAVLHGCVTFVGSCSHASRSAATSRVSRAVAGAVSGSSVCQLGLPPGWVCHRIGFAIAFAVFLGPALFTASNITWSFCRRRKWRRTWMRRATN